MRESVHVQPDQLFLATDLAVIPSEPAGTLARAEAVFDHPREVARLQPLRPTPAQSAGGHAATPSGVARSMISSSATARRDPSTSCTRTSAAPCSKHHT